MTKDKLIFFITTGLIIWGLAGAFRPPEPWERRGRDTDLFAAVVERVRDGQPYYLADGAEMRLEGYPTASTFNWRLPTLTWFQAELPSRGWSILILSAISLTTFVLWVLRLRWLSGRKMAFAVIALILALPTWPWMVPSTSFLHDLWAGQLIALSLACWASGFVTGSLCAGLAAVSIRELALPYVLVMAAAAAFERRSREAIAWAAISVAFGIALLWHISLARPLTDPASAYYGWLALGGWRFVLQTTQVNAFLMEAPVWFVALVIPCAWAGLFVWSAPEGRRAAATVSAYLAAFTIVGRPDNGYWGLLVAPILPLGLIGWLTWSRSARAVRAVP